MDREHRLKRIRYRAWHRGTKEADLLIGGFFDRYGEGWSEPEMAWYEALLQEQDVDIMAWALGTLPIPPQFQGGLMPLFKRLDYIPISE